MIATEYIHFGLHSDLGSRKDTKESVTFNLSIWRSIDHLAGKTCYRSPILECDNKISSIENVHGCVDGNLGEKAVFHDKAQHKFIWGNIWTLDA